MVINSKRGIWLIGECSKRITGSNLPFNKQVLSYLCINTVMEGQSKKQLV